MPRLDPELLWTWLTPSGTGDSAHVPLLTHNLHLCSFRGPVCPDWLQEQLLSWMIESAERGRPGFREMLTMTPCDLFSLVRGRTMWLMGDSMMQVPALGNQSLSHPAPTCLF